MSLHYLVKEQTQTMILQLVFFMLRTSASHPIYINFIDFKWSHLNNAFGITLAPGKYQPVAYTGGWHRDLHQDLHKIKHQYKIDTLVSLLQVDEAARLKISHQLEEAEKIGIKAYNFPVVDCSIPDKTQDYMLLAKEIVDGHLKVGKNVVVHCMGGLGRAPTFAATCLIYAGLPAQDAIKVVQKARPESLTLQVQINFLKRLKFG